ncbi:hypothetical protein [Streptomyces bluensis]|uniref:hypothetical protein n=1 Tax=Streptomyces bluensis TaxID=33897 RepID=UPI003333984A
MTGPVFPGRQFAQLRVPQGDTDRTSAVSVVGGTVVLATLVIALPEADYAWGGAETDYAWGGAAGFAVMAIACVPAFWLVRFLPDAAEHSRGPTSTLSVSSRVRMRRSAAG